MQFAADCALSLATPMSRMSWVFLRDHAKPVRARPGRRQGVPDHALRPQSEASLSVEAARGLARHPQRFIADGPVPAHRIQGHPGREPIGPSCEHADLRSRARDPRPRTINASFAGMTVLDVPLRRLIWQVMDPKRPSPLGKSSTDSRPSAHIGLPRKSATSRDHARHTNRLHCPRRHHPHEHITVDHRIGQPAPLRRHRSSAALAANSSMTTLTPLEPPPARSAPECQANSLRTRGIALRRTATFTLLTAVKRMSLVATVGAVGGRPADVPQPTSASRRGSSLRNHGRETDLSGDHRSGLDPVLGMLSSAPATLGNLGADTERSQRPMASFTDQVGHVGELRRQESY